MKQLPFIRSSHQMAWSSRWTYWPRQSLLCRLVFISWCRTSIISFIFCVRWYANSLLHACKYMYMYDYFILLIINNEFEWAYCRYGKVYVLKHLIYDTKVVTNGKHLNLSKVNHNLFYEKGVVRVIELWEMFSCIYYNVVTVLSWAFIWTDFETLHSNFVKKTKNWLLYNKH